MADKNPPMDPAVRTAVGVALSRVPTTLYVLTAAHEDRRAGILAAWVMQTCFEPPMISVAIMKGRPVMPLISESRRFALCQLGEQDRLIQRRFTNRAETQDDPFLSFDLLPPAKLLGLPIVRTTVGALECELVCHMDVEGDHDLFVGRVVHARNFDGSPMVRNRQDGFAY